MKRTLLLIFLLATPLLAEMKYASVTLDTINYSKIENRSRLFGCFFEFMHDFINGENGLWAQELYDRGFDHYKNANFSVKWEPLNNQSNTGVKLTYGGYNENGEYYQNISSDKAQVVGLIQNIYFDTDKGGVFYIYLKNNYSSPSKFALRILSQADKSILFSDSVIVSDGSWKKYSLTVPPFISDNRISVALCIIGKGDIDLDEASFMPSDNVNGVRKEFFDMFAAWRPGVIRYPGGWFSDTYLCHPDYMIGDIDKRKSPQLMGSDYQRLDFGINEFMTFCHSIGAEAHMVVNLREAPPEEAADWVDYCNGDSTTEYGRKRIADGHPEPYNVRYWEIGNEQWEADYMLPRYAERFDAMYPRDTNIYGIVDGDMWQGKTFFNKVMNYLGPKCRLYGWHPYMTLDKKFMDTKDSAHTYNLVMGVVSLVDGFMNDHEKYLYENNLYPFAKQAITEHCLLWGPLNGKDTTWRNSTLEAGLYQAGTLITVLKRFKTMELYEKTFGYGHIKIGYNKSGKRVIYPTPFHTVTEFMARNSGDILYNPQVNSPTMPVGLYNGDVIWDIPALEVLASSQADTLYIYLLNKHFTDSMAVSLTQAFELDTAMTQAYEMNSASLYDYNTPDEPDKISFREVNAKNVENLVVGPRSVYVIKSHFKSVKDTAFVNDVISFGPNPAENYLKVSISGRDRIQTLIVYDQFGDRMISRFNVDSNESILNLGTLAPGFYIVEVTSSKLKRSFKFVKS